MAGGRKCEPGCACGRHTRSGNRHVCPPECGCGSHKGMLGKAHTAEARAKMTAARTGVKRGPHPPGCECKVHDRPSGTREYKNAVARAWYARNPRPKDKARQGHLWTRHRMTEADYRAMWRAQDGRCCYCERPLPEDQRQIHIDHDHSCTCGPKSTCAACRRGLACEACNIAVGKGGDDPDRLERMAGNLRRLKAEARERISVKPVQDEPPLPLTVVEFRPTARGGAA